MESAVNTTRKRNSEAGFTILETVVAMAIFAIGVLALTQVQFAAARINMKSRTTSTASMLASDRLESITTRKYFSSITKANFPDEAYGQIHGAEGRFSKYRRTVDIVDTMDLAGRVSMKTVTVKVFWKDLHGEKSITLASNIAKF